MITIATCAAAREVEMSTEEYVRCLRSASEHEVTKALNGAKVALPLTTEYEALEFFNCMLDVMSNVRVDEEEAASHCIKPGFGSTGE